MGPQVPCVRRRVALDARLPKESHDGVEATAKWRGGYRQGRRPEEVGEVL